MNAIPPVIPRGGLPPYEPWHNGKTPQSIDFVDLTRRFIKTNPTHPAIAILEEALNKTLSGELVIKDWTSPEQYLDEIQANDKLVPPPDLNWQIGKTIASIQFVNDAERFIKDNSQRNEVIMLQEVIQRIKEGKEIFKSFYTPEQYIKEVEELGKV